MRNQDNRPRMSEGSQLIRHDGMTIVAQFYEIWSAEPNITESGEWKGTNMWKLWQHDLTKAEGVHGFVNWINEIHRWGKPR